MRTFEQNCLETDNDLASESSRPHRSKRPRVARRVQDCRLCWMKHLHSMIPTSRPSRTAGRTAIGWRWREPPAPSEHDGGRGLSGHHSPGGGDRRALGQTLRWKVAHDLRGRRRPRHVPQRLRPGRAAVPEDSGVVPRRADPVRAAFCPHAGPRAGALRLARGCRGQGVGPSELLDARVTAPYFSPASNAAATRPRVPASLRDAGALTPRRSHWRRAFPHNT